MTKTIDANQLTKAYRPYIRPIYLVKMLLPGLDLYLSDRNFVYGGQTYEDYLSDFSKIGNQIRVSGGYDNSPVTLSFKNQPIRTSNYLIEFFDTYTPEKRYVEIYRLYMDVNEEVSPDTATKVFKGEMGSPYDVDEMGFKIDCSSMLFGKSASLPLKVIKLADFPSADPDDVGKNRNILYGNLQKVICPWTVAGWVSAITADITAGATSIVVSESTGAPATPFTMIVDSEQLRVTNKSGTTFTCTRGYGGTPAVGHGKASVCYEQRADFEAEVAQHPVKSIGDVFVYRGGERGWLRVISGYTAYTNSGGRAKIVFTDKVKWEESVEFTQNTSIGNHGHGLATTAHSMKTCIPYDSTPLNKAAYDGNESSYMGGSSNTTFYFNDANIGTIVRQWIHIIFNASGLSGLIQCGGVNTTPAQCGPGGFMPAGSRWSYRVYKDGGAWTNDVSIITGAAGNICEVWKEIEYIPVESVANNVATGVDWLLSGNSVANMMIGQYVAANVEGYADDGIGTYTGTPNSLIQRPDHIRKHILCGLLGFSLADDIDATSFNNSGANYAGLPGSYNMAFNLPEVSTETCKLFEEIDRQSRSNMFESQGKFKLSVRPMFGYSSTMTFNSDNLKKPFPVFSKSDVPDIKNILNGYFQRDYLKSSGKLGEMYQNLAEGRSTTSVTKYGEQIEDIVFSCFQNSACQPSVEDVVWFICLEKQELLRWVNLQAYWDSAILDNCDFFRVTSNFWNGLLFEVITLVESPDGSSIEIVGREMLPAVP